MSLFIGVLAYLGLIGVITLAGMVLHAYRGVSLLAVYVACAALQTGLTVFHAVAAAEVDVLVNLTDTAANRFGLSLLIFYGITGLFLYGLWRLRNPAAQLIRPMGLRLPETWKVATLVLLGAFIGLRMLSPTSLHVFAQGHDAIVAGQYYDMRSEIIQLDLETSSRILFQTETALRRVLFIILIVSAFEVLTVPSVGATVLFGVLFAGLAVAEITRFQKGPLAWVVAAGAVPFIIGRANSWRSNYTVLTVKIILSAGVLILVSGLLYTLTEGYSLGDAVWRVTQRFFLIPSYTSMMYFEVYPDSLPHVQWADLRPVRELFGTVALQPRNGLISVDVAEVLTGQLWSANAGIVAESWAAAGYLGVILGSLVLAGFGFVVDRHTAQKLGQINLTPLAVYYWLGLLVYGNSALLYALGEYGLWFVPFLYCFAMDKAMRVSTNALYLPFIPPAKSPRPTA